MTLNMSFSFNGQNANQFTIASAIVKWLDEVGPAAREAVKDETPVGQGAGAGRMKDTTRYQRATLKSTPIGYITQSTPYVRYVIDGTAPHLIEPRAARYLHWSGIGGDHFAKVVHHPGTHANDYPERALMPLQPLIKERLATIVQQMLEA